MTIKSTGHWMAFVAALLLAAAAAAAGNPSLDELMSRNGLQKVKVRGLEMVYARPGATLAGYGRVMLEPVEVEFRKGWEPTRPGSSTRKLTVEELESIRSGVAKIVQEQFVKELQDKGLYRIVTETGPDVLRVSARIFNLYVTAPDVPTAGRVTTYVVSSGEMTLFMELFDSASGQVIARVADRQEARSTGAMTLSNRVVNAAEAENIAGTWARILRKRLDQAHDIGKK